MKQETLEEAAKLNALSEVEQYQPTKEKFKLSYKNSFLRGAKWQQERSYSEEEVLKILNTFSIDSKSPAERDDILIWFKQFKNK
jgi:hypothetical protein